jgi:hypothetical protein
MSSSKSSKFTKKKKSAPKGAAERKRQSLSSSLSPLYSPVGSSLGMALDALRNNETRVTMEAKGVGGKTVMETKVSYPPDLLKAMKGLFPASRSYDFEMHYPSTQTSSAAGSLLGSIALDPGATSWAEWSTLSALFDEVVGVSSRISFLSTYAAAGLTTIPMVLAFDEIQTGSTAPSSITAIIRLAESCTFVMSLGTAGSGKFTKSRKLTSREWCSTAYPSAVQPLGGLAGRWDFGNSAVFPNSTSIAFVDLRAHARFRNRA